LGKVKRKTDTSALSALPVRIMAAKKFLLAFFFVFVFVFFGTTSGGYSKDFLLI